MYENELSGSIPHEIKSLPKVSDPALDANEFIGYLPYQGKLLWKFSIGNN